MHLYAWKAGSNGAAELAQALGIKRIKRDNSKFKGGPTKTVINWGSTELPVEVQKSKVLNRPEAVKKCTNKLVFFNTVAGNVSIPDFTNDYDTAVRWVGEGNTVCARKVLNGHGADGLVLMSQDNPREWVKAPLYTKYVPKRDEYRVHVIKGNVVHIQRKALRPGRAEEGEINWKVRNLENGFIYVIGDVNPPEDVLLQAKKAVETIGLDFGAVDVIYNEKKDKAFVLEINTAPGLQGETIQKYAEALK